MGKEARVARTAEQLFRALKAGPVEMTSDEWGILTSNASKVKDLLSREVLGLEGDLFRVTMRL